MCSQEERDLQVEYAKVRRKELLGVATPRNKQLSKASIALSASEQAQQIVKEWDGFSTKEKLRFKEMVTKKNKPHQ